MLETERLILRPLEPTDLPRFIEMRQDEEVMKYLGGWTINNLEALTKRFDFYLDCHRKFGFGMCAMIWKETGEFFGWSGLQPLVDTDEIEIGYGMVKEFWGKGIGYECGRAWLDHGFKTLGLERIVAVADPANTGSWRIMEKLGMRFEKLEPHYNMTCRYYGISKDEYLNQSK